MDLLPIILGLPLDKWSHVLGFYDESFPHVVFKLSLSLSLMTKNCVYHTFRYYASNCFDNEVQTF